MRQTNRQSLPVSSAHQSIITANHGESLLYNKTLSGEEETGESVEEDGSRRKQAENTRLGFQDWDSSGSYSQQRNYILSSVV